MSVVRDNIKSMLDARMRFLGIKRAYGDVFGSPQGKIVLRDLMRLGGVLQVVHEQGDSHQTAFNAGKQALVFEILRRMRWTESELADLAEERDGGDL